MATSIGIGFSQHKDSLTAAQEAAQQAKEQLKKERIDFAILLNTPHYAPEEILPIIFKTLDQTKVIGSSTVAIILNDQVETRGVGILAFHSDNILFETAAISHLDLQDIQEAGQLFGQNSIIDWGERHRKAFLFFADGSLTDISGLTAGLKEKLGHFFTIAGAGSTGDFHFQRNIQYHRDAYFSKSAVGVQLGGKPILAISGKHGWKPLGKPRTITSCQKNIIQTIDHQSAFSLYREYFNKDAEALKFNRLGQINVRYPLGIFRNTKEEYLLRNIVQVLDDESIVCQDSIEKDSTVHIMLGNRETCLQAVEQAALELKEQLKLQKPSVIIVLESILRYKLLGRAVLEELKSIQRIIGEDIPIFGMYSHGEIFPTKSEHHIETIANNGSAILMAIG